jgi:hypothetical protein
VDILTDILIMIIPLVLVYKVKISTRQKLGLCAVLQPGPSHHLALVTIIIAIVRCVQSITNQRELLFLAIWSTVESYICTYHFLRSMPANSTQLSLLDACLLLRLCSAGGTVGPLEARATRIRALLMAVMDPFLSGRTCHTFRTQPRSCRTALAPPRAA